VPTEKEWSAYAADRGLDSRVIGFINLFPSLLHEIRKDNRELYAAPNPRGWEFVSNNILGVDDHNYVHQLTCMPVGDAAGIQFKKFIELDTMGITVEDLLKDPKRIKSITRGDIQWVLISGLAEKYRSVPKALPAILKVVPELNPEFAVHMLRLLKGIGQESFIKTMTGKKEYLELLEKYVPYMADITE